MQHLTTPARQQARAIVVENSTAPVQQRCKRKRSTEVDDSDHNAADNEALQHQHLPAELAAPYGFPPRQTLGVADLPPPSACDIDMDSLRTPCVEQALSPMR